MMTDKLAQRRLFFGSVMATFLLIAVPAALSTMEYKTGDLIFVSLTNATDGSIVQGANCTITVINGTVAAYVNASMADAYDGTHYWAIPAGLVSQPAVPYRAKAICNWTTTHDWQDVTYFYVVDIHSPQRLFGLNLTLNDSIAGIPKFDDIYDGTLSQVQSCGQGSSNLTVCGQGDSNLTDAEVWAYADRTLTQNITGNFSEEGVSETIWSAATRTLTQNITMNLTAEDIWASADRQLTAFAFDVNVTDEALANIATAVWDAGTRTLTDFGTLVDDTAAAVWAYATRELTGFGTLVTDIWASATRTLTAVSITNATQTAQLENASANVTIVTGASYYNTDNSTFNIILPVSD